MLYCNCRYLRTKMDHKQDQTKPIHPQTQANRFSKMSFWWLKNLYKDGLRRPLNDGDIYENLKDHDSHEIAEKFTKLWDDELKRKNPSVLRMFYRAYGLPVLMVGLSFSILESLNRCAQPLFLGALLSYFVDDRVTKETAYWYAAGIVACSLIPVLTFHPFIYYVIEHGMKYRIGASRLVYDKLLRMTKSAQVDGLQGRVINLLSNDFSKFDIALCFVHDLWKGPLETLLLGYLVYREIGISGIIGIAFILSFIPIQCE